jgi:hypothetical protein
MGLCTGAKSPWGQEQKLLVLATHASVLQVSIVKYGLDISSQGGPCQVR